MKSHYLFSMVLSVLAVFVTTTAAAASEEEEEEPTNVLIVGFEDGGVEQLPGAYVTIFERWILLGEDDFFTLQMIPSHFTGNGFVNPTSLTDLWWPMDLDQLHARPTLDVIFKNGKPEYVCGGVDIRVPASSAANEDEWRNYGMHSQPLARQWLPFRASGKPGFSVEAFIGSKSSNSDEVEWKSMGGNQKIDKAMETFGVFASGLDGSTPLAQGFHVVSVPVRKGWTKLPRGGGYALATIASTDQDKASLLSQPPSTTMSILAVDVKETAPGGASEHLPDAYKPLYIPTTTA